MAVSCGLPGWFWCLPVAARKLRRQEVDPALSMSKVDAIGADLTVLSI